MRRLEMMLAGLRGIASRPLRSGSQTLYSHAVCATPFRFCCIAPTLKSRYATRKPDAKDTNRHSKQFDLDVSALRESQKPEQQLGNSSQPRFRRDQHHDGDAQDSARRRDDDKPQNSARQRHRAMLEYQYVRQQSTEFAKQSMAFCARSLNATDDTPNLQWAGEMTILLATARRLELVQLKKLSTFAVAVIFAPLGAEDVTTVKRMRLALALTLSTVHYVGFQPLIGIPSVLLKLYVKIVEGMEKRNR